MAHNNEQNFTLRLDLMATYTRNMRIQEVKNRGDPSKRPAVLPGPGDGYAPGDRSMITCPICGQKAWIAPRMHPYWLRDREGRVHFVDREPCTGEKPAWISGKGACLM